MVYVPPYKAFLGARAKTIILLCICLARELPTLAKFNCFRLNFKIILLISNVGVEITTEIKTVCVCARVCVESALFACECVLSHQSNFEYW